MQIPSLPPISELSFWWGIALAVPLSIVANLMTPLLLRGIGFFSTTLRERRQRLEALERVQAEALANDPARYSNEQFDSLLLFTIVGALGGIFTGLTASLAHMVYVIGGPDQLGQSLFLASQAVGVLVSLVVLNFAKKVWRTHRLIQAAKTLKSRETHSTGAVPGGSGDRP